MQANDYQKKAHEFANYGSKMYPYLGLAEEAGEVAGKIAKFLRHNNGTSPHCVGPELDKEAYNEFRNDVRKELGDTLWMVAEIATLNGLTIEGIMDSNIAKLTDRKARGVINGSGDNR